MTRTSKEHVTRKERPREDVWRISRCLEDADVCVDLHTVVLCLSADEQSLNKALQGPRILTYISSAKRGVCFTVRWEQRLLERLCLCDPQAVPKPHTARHPLKNNNKNDFFFSFFSALAPNLSSSAVWDCSSWAVSERRVLLRVLGTGRCSFYPDTWSIFHLSWWAHTGSLWH